MFELRIHETAGKRIQVLSRPIVLPGKCAVCGHTGTNTNDTTPVVFIDFGLDVDYYGRVYLCSTCVVETANTLGFTSPVDTEKMLNKTQILESELIVLREQNERLRASLSSLLGGANLTMQPDFSVATEIIAERIESPTGESDSGERKVTPSNEFVSGGGSVGLSAITNIDEFDF